MHTEKPPQESTWEENILNALYYAFAASDAEGRAFFLNLVLENFYKRPSFLAKLYEEVAAIRAEGIFEASEETWSWVEFWRQFNLSDKEKFPAQIERLQSLRKEEALSREGQGTLHFLLALMEYECGAYQAAAQLYEQSAQFLPVFSWTYLNWGISLGDIGRHEEAIAKYQKAIELDPKYVKAYYSWGNSLENLGRHKEAIAKYRKAIELDPKHVNAYDGWGDSLANFGQDEQEYAKRPKAIEIDPRFDAAFNKIRPSRRKPPTLSDLKKSAYRRTKLLIILFLLLECSIVLLASKFGAGENLFQKVINSWPYFGVVVPAILFLLFTFWLGQERLKVLDWPILKFILKEIRR